MAQLNTINGDVPFSFTMENPMNPNDNPIANPVAVLREEFDDWAVLFNPDTAEAVGLNPVGAAIWKLLDGEHTVVQITDQIRVQFAHVPGQVEGEITAFLTDLEQRGFIGFKVDAK
jgi:SynChlorMet cassette protein ScmD